MPNQRNSFGDDVIGQGVITQDGVLLGNVKELRGAYFKVDAPMQRDYWLSTECIRASSGGQITLAVSETQLDDYKVSEPDGSAPMSGMTGSRGIGGGTAGAMSSATSDTRDLPRDRTDAGRTMGDAVTTGRSTIARPWTDASSDYQQSWQRRSGASGGRWEDFEPGYRYGHEMAADPRFHNRSWSDAERDLQSGYGTWSTSQGYTGGDWSRHREGIREAYEGYHTSGRRGVIDDDQERTVRLREEELMARTEREKVGEVGLHKEVVTEQKSIDVPVTHEEVYIERHPVRGTEPAGGAIGEDEEIRVPVMEEHVEVEKRPVVTEEVSIGKRTVEDTERVTDTVRREELRVDHDGDVEVRGDADIDRGRTTRPNMRGGGADDLPGRTRADVPSDGIPANPGTDALRRQSDRL